MNREDIEKLMQGDDQGAVISELQNGRGFPMAEPQSFINEIEPEFHKVMDRTIRRDKWVNCTDDDTAFEDDPDTKVITSSLGDRTQKRREPVARVALAMQKLIVKRAIAFCFGNPVRLNIDNEDKNAQNVLKALNRVNFDNKIDTVNRRIARSLFSCTEVAELWYPVKKETNKNYGFETSFKLRCSIFSPLKGDYLYPYFDEIGDMIAFSREYSIEDSQHNQHKFFETYTDKDYRLWTLDNGQWTIKEKRANSLGKIPVIYAHQPESEWADVQYLIDRLEKLLSNFADTNDYHAAPKIFTTGNIYGWAKKGESGAIIEGEEGATAQYLSWSQAPEAVKLEIETLLQMIYTITQTPDISWDSVKGMNVSGVALKFLFMDAHLKVQEHNEVLGDYLQRRVSVIKEFLKNMNSKDKAFRTACDEVIIEPEIVPYMIDDDSQTVQTLMQATGNKAILSRKTAVQQLGWVNNPDKEIKQIESEDSAKEENDVTEPNL